MKRLSASLLLATLIFSAPVDGLCQNGNGNKTGSPAKTEEITGAFVKVVKDPFPRMYVTDFGNEDHVYIACPMKTIEEYDFAAGDWVSVEYQVAPLSSVFPYMRDREMVKICKNAHQWGSFAYGLYEAYSEGDRARLHLVETNGIYDKFTLEIWNRKTGETIVRNGELMNHNGLLTFYADSAETASNSLFTLKYGFGELTLDKTSWDVLKDTFMNFMYQPRHTASEEGIPDIRKDEIAPMTHFLQAIYEVATECAGMEDGIDLSTKQYSAKKLLFFGIYHGLGESDNVKNGPHGRPLKFYDWEPNDHYTLVPVSDVARGLKQVLDYDLDVTKLPDLSEYGIIVVDGNFAIAPSDPGIFDGFYITNVKRARNGMLHITMIDKCADENGNKSTYNAILKDQIVDGKREYKVIKVVRNK